MMLRAHTTMLAMLAIEPSVPASGIPHVGLTPTGAVFGLEDTLLKTALFVSCTCERRDDAKTRLRSEPWPRGCRQTPT